MTEGCYTLIYNLRRDPPQETTRIDSNQYEGADILAGVLSTLPNVDVSIVQPTITVRPNMQLTTTNGGKCVNVFVDCTAEYVPGKVVVDPPDVTIPAPPLPAPMTIPIGPFEFNIGQPGTSRLQAEYRVCCCEWSDDLPEYERRMGEIIPTEEEVVILLEGCEHDHVIEKLLFRVTGATNIVSWKIKALEGPCRFKNAAARGPDGTRPVKLSPRDRGLQPKRDVTRP